MAEKDKRDATFLGSLASLTGQVAEGTFDLARNAATLTAMFGENWLRSALLTRLEPERLEAMAEAGRFLRDARETAGLSMREFADMLGLSDRTVLEEIESGQTLMPLELMLRSAALLARHDPIPFLIKFMRTYNPALEQTLEQWGVMALPRQIERERRFINLLRQHDMLRSLSDDEYERFIHYVDSSCQLVLDVMLNEREAVAGKLPAPGSGSRKTGSRQTGSSKTGSRKTTATRNKAKPKARAKTNTAPKKAASGKRSRKSAS